MITRYINPNYQPKAEYEIMVKRLPEVFQEIERWMAEHYLQLNPGKTEIIVFGSAKTLSKLNIHGCFINPEICVRFKSTVKNLGFSLDAGLQFGEQIKALKSSCYHKLRNIAKMKPFLTSSQMKTLTQALVISSLDYCNALYDGIEPSKLDQLQSIQNRACRITFGLNRRESVDKYLIKLHWLKIRERIEFKLLLLVYKSLNGLAPSYLSDLLRFNNMSGSRTPSLAVPALSSVLGNRAFVCHGPKLWNDLPAEIKYSDNVTIFKKRLKTHLFTKSHNL